jgi:tRNA G18 (ribose-2'-O)-methylase SpoU
MERVEIEQPDDPRLEPYRAVREVELARSHGLFLAEGRVVLDTLLQRGRHPLASVLVARRVLASHAVLLERVPAGVPIYVASQEAMDRVAGFPIHRGLLAAGRRLPLPSPPELLAGLPAGPATLLVLEGLTNHDNTGGCFRAAAAFGVQALLLDGTCCDPLYRKSIRVSAGHALTLPFSHGGPIRETLEALKAAGFLVAALSPCGDARALEGCPRPAARLALLLGSEGPGLSQQALERADLRLRISMAHGVDSLNVAMAAAVALFALR